MAKTCALVAGLLLLAVPASAQLKIATGSASAAADAVVDRIDAGSGPGTLVIFGSACPDAANDADSGTTLAVLTFSDPAFGAASNGVATANAITADASANATGTAMCFRAKDSNAVVVFQGSITTSGGGGNLILSSTSITAGQSVAISALTYTQPTQTADIFAPTCSASDVQTALNAATAGDVIAIPAGTCNWTTQVAWTAPANVFVRGAGSLSTLGGGDATIITDGYASGSSLLDITANATGTLRLAGVTVRATSASNAKTGGTVILRGPATVRLDHLHLDTSTNSITGNYILWIGDRVIGVLDNALIDLHQNSSIYFLNGSGADGFGNQSWADATNFGGAGFFFMEDNSFVGTASAPMRISDSSGASRFVVRFNDITGGSGVEAHATGHVSIGDRGPRAQESYGNHFMVLPGQSSPPFNIANLGSGVALVWGNDADTDAIKNPMVFRVVRKDNAVYTQVATPNGWGYCGTAFNGTGSNWDGNTPSASTGYPCLDQIGRGQGDLLTGSGSSTVNSTTGTIAWPHQALEPVYFWKNVATPAAGYGGSFYTDDTSGRLTANVDYYPQASGVQTTSSSPFSGATGTGWGTVANRPSTCTTGVGYFATDQGSWNTSSSNAYGVQQSGADGVLYKCTSTNTWTSYYTPYTYPHPLR